MLKRLRNRLLLVNMAALSLVMVSAFAIVYAVTYSNTMAEIQRKVARVPFFLAAAYDGAPQDFPGINSLTDSNESNGDNSADNTTQEGNGQSRSQSTLPLDFSPSFSLALDTDGKILYVNTYLNLQRSAYEEALQKAEEVGSSNGRIEFEDRLWQYSYSAGNLISATSVLAVDSSGNPFEYMARGVTQVNFVDITETMDGLTRLLITFVAAATLMMAVIFAVSFYFANRSIRPIEATFSKQRQFVADASHELKTPIAVVTANIDALEAAPEASVASQKKWIDYARHELSRMGTLINDLLYLASSEDGKSEMSVLCLSDVVEEACTSMEVLLFEKQIAFEQNIQTDVYVTADQVKINQAIIILLDNAAKYTNPQGHIWVTLSAEKGQARLIVANTGAGIDSEDLPNIFDRFYRPDESRSTQSGGYGLGLSIFRAIVERSGGKIHVQSSQGLTEFGFYMRNETPR